MAIGSNQNAQSHNASVLGELKGQIVSGRDLCFACYQACGLRSSYPLTTRNPSATPHEDSPQIDHETASLFDGFDSVSTRILLLQMTVPVRDRKGF